MRWSSEGLKATGMYGEGEGDHWPDSFDIRTSYTAVVLGDDRGFTLIQILFYGIKLAV